MQLYERNYFELTEEEKRIAKKIDAKKTMGAGALTSIPAFYFFSRSIFPNNMLDIDELSDGSSKKRITDFERVLNDTATRERDVINFIAKKRAHFIIASLLCNYDFGHHAAYLFPEFRLSTNHVVDYLVVGRNSGGHEFVFVELESVYGGITNQDGSIGNCIRKGMKQVEDWQFWLAKNFRNLTAEFDKHRNINEPLPTEFLDFDPTRMHYVVVAGRRTDYSNDVYRKRRKLQKESELRMMHYDNLVDCARNVTSSGNYV